MEGVFGVLKCIRSGLSGIRSSIGGTNGLVGSSVGFSPLQTGVVGVSDEEDKRYGGQEQGRPFIRREGEYLEFLAFLLFVVGLWFVYTAFRVEKITAISISKILFGVIIIVLGWATEQAALNLIHFGYIDWSHLL